MNKLTNPFKYIAGWESLAAGMGVLLLTTVIGYFSHIHFPDVISVKVAYGIPFYVLLLQGASNWLVVSLLLYISALLFSRSSVRIIDIFGTQALARFPYLLAALTGFGGLLDKFGKYMIYYALHTGEPVQMSTPEIALCVFLILFTILLTVWMIALMFNAFKVSSNMKGEKLIISFIVVITGSIILTGLVSSQILKVVLPL